MTDCSTSNPDVAIPSLPERFCICDIASGVIADYDSDVNHEPHCLNREDAQ